MGEHARQTRGPERAIVLVIGRPRWRQREMRICSFESERFLSFDSESYPSAQPGNQGRTTQLNALGARLERGRAGPGRLRGARTPYHIPMILQGCRWSRSWPPSSAICEHARASRPRRRNNSVLNAPATRLVRPCSQHCRQQPWQNNSAQCLGAPPRPIDSDQGVGVGRARATRRRANTAIGH